MFSVSQKLMFLITNLEINLVEYVHMDHTGHFSFRSNVILIWEIFPKKNGLGETSLFEMIVKMNEFLGGIF